MIESKISVISIINRMLKSFWSISSYGWLLDEATHRKVGMHKFSRKKKTSKVKNVESAVNAILTQAIHE